MSILGFYLIKILNNCLPHFNIHYMWETTFWHFQILTFWTIIKQQTCIVMLRIILSCHPWYYTNSWELTNDTKRRRRRNQYNKNDVTWDNNWLKRLPIEGQVSLFSHRIYVVFAFERWGIVYFVNILIM